MYKLLIVDDEEIIREGIVKSIRWDELGFEVVGQSCNGSEAIEFIKNTPVDVILTDIRMPDMDGVDLMDYIALNYPSIKVIVLSGYNDFEYLKSSIKSNVYDYLLKPTRISEFIEVFKKLKLVMDEEMQKSQEYDELRKSLIENLPYLEQIFLNQLCSGYYQNLNEISDKKKFYQLDMLDGNLMMVVIEVDNLRSISKDLSEESKQLLPLFIVHMANKIAEDTIQGRFFTGDNGSIIGICCANSGTSSLINLLKEIQKRVYEVKKLYLSAGVSNEFENLLEANKYYRQAKHAVKQKICLGTQSIVLFSDIETVSEIDIPSIEFELELITDYIFSGKKDEIKEYVKSNLSCLKNKIFESYEFFNLSMMKLLFELNNFFAQYGISVRNIMKLRQTAFNEVYEIDTLEYKTEWLVSILDDISGEICKNRQDKVTKLIDEVKRYLQKNFDDNRICLESVADLFKKSPPYLSKLFKEESGDNFSDYLTKLRMEKAKSLLKDIKTKVYEVPSMVGYSDISHFSRKFKSYTGMSPAQFRDK